MSASIARRSSLSHSLKSVTLSSVHEDNRFEVLTNAGQFYPAMLDAIAERPADDQHGMLHLPARRDRTAVHERDDGARAGRRRRHAGRRRHRQLLVRSVRDSRDARRRLPGRVVSTFEVVSPFAVEQPHAPRAPHRRWQVAFLGGAGVGDQWSKGRARQAAMARHDGAGDRAGGLIDPGRVCRKLGGVLRRDSVRPGVLSDSRRRAATRRPIVIKSSPADRATACRVVFQMLIESATQADSHQHAVLSSRQVAAPGVHRQRRTRREDRHHRARIAHRSAMGPARQPPEIQRAASCRASGSTSIAPA